MEIFNKILLQKEKSFEDLEKKGAKYVKNNYLEKNSIISSLFKEALSQKGLEKSKLGVLINDWRKELSEKVLNSEIKGKETDGWINDYSVTAFEGKKINLGSIHPITKIINEIYDFFSYLGYEVIESSEIENEENNFDKLNMPADHPARGMHDTFYLENDNLLLRTHTSNTQIRVMRENPNKDLRVVSSGKVYRRDEDDATHTHQFTQLEVFSIGKGISFSNLKGTIESFLEKIFGRNHPIRFRPSYFPFTEPSVEVDAKCVNCSSNKTIKDCKVCKGTGWVEILGAGLIHDKVLENCGFDSKKFTGFAFGLGIERLLMIQHGIEDIRNFYLNDSRFLSQFKKFNI